jgi:hypothetical protein
MKAALLALFLAGWGHAETRLRLDWLAPHDGKGYTGVEARGLAADRYGNAFAAGSIVTPDEGRNIFVEKLNQADGSVQWTRQVDGPSRGHDEGYAVAVDSSGCAFAAGSVESVGRGTDAWIGKFDPAGNRLWSFVLNGPANADDAAYGVCVDTYGRVYFTGAFGVPGSGSQIWVAKYSSSGTALAQAFYGDAGDDRATGCSAGGDDVLFVSGSVSDPAAPSTQSLRTHAWLGAFDVKASTSLKPLSSVLDEGSWGSAEAVASARLATGLQAVFTVGVASREVTGLDAHVTRWVFTRSKPLDPWSNLREVFYDGPVHAADGAYAAAVDAGGNLYAAGYETVTDLEGTFVRVAWYRCYDPYLLKENPDAYRSNASADSGDEYQGIFLDSYHDMVFASGAEYSAANSYEAIIHALDAQSGTPLQQWRSGNTFWEYPRANLTADAAGNFFVAGGHPNRIWKVERGKNGLGPMDWYSHYDPVPGAVPGRFFGSALASDGSLVTVGDNSRPGSYSDVYVAKWDVKTHRA